MVPGSVHRAVLFVALNAVGIQISVQTKFPWHFTVVQIRLGTELYSPISLSWLAKLFSLKNVRKIVITYYRQPRVYVVSGIRFIFLNTDTAFSKWILEIDSTEIRAGKSSAFFIVNST